jgi:hypothetical protein
VVSEEGITREVISSSEQNIMYLTIEEAREADVPVRIVIENLKEHGYNPSEFFLEIGYREFYSGSVVLDWMGY